MSIQEAAQAVENAFRNISIIATDILMQGIDKIYENIEGQQDNTECCEARQQDSEIRNNMIQRIDKILETMEHIKWQQAKENEPETVSDIIESVKIEICDKYCKKPYEIKDEADLIEVCGKCPMWRL